MAAEPAETLATPGCGSGLMPEAPAGSLDCPTLGCLDPNGTPRHQVQDSGLSGLWLVGSISQVDTESLTSPPAPAHPGDSWLGRLGKVVCHRAAHACRPHRVGAGLCSVSIGPLHPWVRQLTRALSKYQPCLPQRLARGWAPRHRWGQTSELLIF